MGRMGTNTEGYITEISQDFENCKMWDFDWKDMQVLMVINALNSSDENEAHLAEKLTESYKSSILKKKSLGNATDPEDNIGILGGDKRKEASHVQLRKRKEKRKR